jgi:hypothetical protein
MFTATFAIGTILDPQTVNLQSEISARELMEETYVQLQTAAAPDPFDYTLEYYGYSQAGFGYLGYEIEDIDGNVNGANGSYWVFNVNGTAASVGIDSYMVQPNDAIELQYVNFGAVQDKAVAARLQHVQTLRTKRAAKS